MTGRRGQKQKLPITISQYEDKNEYKRQYYHLKKNPEKSRKDWLKWKYGITIEEYQSLLDKQKGRCAICDTDDPGRFRYFCVDHCHTTGEIRGLLCSICNKGLGLFKDSSEYLVKAIEYLNDTKRGSRLVE